MPSKLTSDFWQILQKRTRKTWFLTAWFVTKNHMNTSHSKSPCYQTHSVLTSLIKLPCWIWQGKHFSKSIEVSCVNSRLWLWRLFRLTWWCKLRILSVVYKLHNKHQQHRKINTHHRQCIYPKQCSSLINSFKTAPVFCTLVPNIF